LVNSGRGKLRSEAALKADMLVMMVMKVVMKKREEETVKSMTISLVC
jgi:hypothetical protein